MKLYLSPTSPYARAVRVTALEKNLEQALTIVPVNPWSSTADFLQVTPVSKVPVLELDQQQTLTESLLILTYLDTHWPEGPRLHSDTTSLALLGLGQGLMDAAFGHVIRQKFSPQIDHNDEQLQRYQLAISRILDSLTPRIQQVPFCIGSIVVAVALEYIDFRLKDIKWHSTHASISDWLEPISCRNSFACTQFQ